MCNVGSQAGGSSFPKSRRIRVERSTHIPISMDKLWGLVEVRMNNEWLLYLGLICSSRNESRCYYGL